MEIVTTEHKVYSSSDLVEGSDIRAKVLDKQRDINVDDSWWSDGEIDSWKELLESIGFSEPKIMFSGFASQGDGACFTCDSFSYAKGTMKRLKAERPTATELHELVQEIVDLQRRNFYSLNGSITHRGHYCHELSTNVEVLRGVDDDAWANDTTHIDMGNPIVSINKMIYKSLEEQYWALQEDENVLETIEANEYRFTEEGDIFSE